ncbi:uncharacterized protein LOC106658660 isoform X2 [Trichogramma pretiosum]|uniref:uncharacterized protein LOC106658660 isoform X2 n=1 Tax=Trichogramma pretiosum TaxID=7493 RepID=UPI0006C99842|nr:uncharacterized protein LOC106658660 isoform X2 [Trichogramma pretiosum]
MAIVARIPTPITGNRASASLLAFGVIMLTAIFVYMLNCTGLVSRHGSRLSNHWVRIA